MLSFIVPSEIKMVRKLYFVKACYHLSLKFNLNIFYYHLPLTPFEL